MTPTDEKLIELIAEAGSPLTLDQIMDMLPYADRQAVSRICRELVQVGRLRSTAEDGRLAYDVANGVSRIKPKPSASGPLTNLERIRQLLMAAKKPLSKDEIQSSLPDMAPATVRKTLSNGAYRKLWASTRRADGVCVYVMPQTGAGSATAVAVATATAAPTPAPARATGAPAPAPVPVPVPPPALAPAAADLSAKLDEAVNMAEVAREAYVLSNVDADIYTWLQESVRAARAARDAFAGGAQ